MDVMCIFLPRDDDCFRPARIMEGGQMFEFGGMCRELMDRVAPTAFSLSAQQMQSTGDQHIPSHLNSDFSCLCVTPSSFIERGPSRCIRRTDRFLNFKYHCVKAVWAKLWLLSAACSSGQSVPYALCEVCNLQLTSDAQAQLHYNGKSHLRRLRQLQAGETVLRSPGTLSSLPVWIRWWSL